MDTEENTRLQLKRAPFGDTFGNKADYTSGTFYAARRKYLVPESGVEGNEDGNVLQPQPEFMTRKQSLRFVRNLKSDGLSTLQNMAYFNQDAVKADAERERKRKAMIKSRKEQNKPIIVQKFTSVNPVDWDVVVQAGCKMWVNHKSGEVSDYPPWKSIEEIDEEKEKAEEAEEVEGTGAPVYDNSELEDFLTLLDKQPPSPTKKK